MKTKYFTSLIKRWMFLATFTFCAAFSISAQNYIPLTAENNQWNVMAEKDILGTILYQRTYIYKLTSDTLIEGIGYYPIIKSTDSTTNDWIRIGFLREDANAKKVYYRNSWDNIDRILYDFDVQIGDTVYTMGIGYYTETMPAYSIDTVCNIVTSIDFIEINGNFHKRIISLADDDVFENEWIEGVGNTNGILFENIYMPGSQGYRLLAFYRDDILVYDNPDYNFEFIWWYNSDASVKTFSDNSDITFFVSDKTLFLNSGENISGNLNLYSLTGQKLLSRRINCTGSAEISLQTIASGVYILHIDSEKSIFNKLIKL